jgi:hypothetical protein
MSTTTTTITHPDGTTLTCTTAPAAPAPAGKLIVAYWSIRGLAAPLRMMCEYAGAEYEAVTYDVTEKDGGGWDVSAWFSVKPELKAQNGYMNLPYVTDGTLCIAQTNACFSHLGRVLGLYGSTYTETAQCEQTLCQVMDLRNDAVKMFYGATPEDNFVGHLNGSVQTQYDKFETFLQQGGTAFTAGATPTAGDFHLFEMIDQHEILAKATDNPSPVADFPLLTKLYTAFKAMPQLAGYFAGPLYALPLNNKMACFGNKPL